MTSLPALREAVAKMTDWRLEVFTEWLFDRPHADDCPCSNDSERHAPGCGNCECENHDIADLLANYKALRNAAPALLDEVEAARHSDALIEAKSRRGITDCSTPLFIRVQNIVEQLEKAEADLAETVKRLESWASANDEERKAGKAPTFLNPHTVLLWLGKDASEAKKGLEQP